MPTHIRCKWQSVNTDGPSAGARAASICGPQLCRTAPGWYRTVASTTSALPRTLSRTSSFMPTIALLWLVRCTGGRATHGPGHGGSPASPGEGPSPQPDRGFPAVCSAAIGRTSTMATGVPGSQVGVVRRRPLGGFVLFADCADPSLRRLFVWAVAAVSVTAWLAVLVFV